MVTHRVSLMEVSGRIFAWGQLQNSLTSSKRRVGTPLGVFLVDRRQGYQDMVFVGNNGTY